MHFGRWRFIKMFPGSGRSYLGGWLAIQAPGRLLVHSCSLRSPFESLLLIVFEREHAFPIAFHTYNRPMSNACFMQAFIQPADTRFAIVCPFTVGVVVMHIEAEVRTRSIG